MWKTVKLGEILELQNGYAFKSKEYTADGYFVMRITNVQQGYISAHNPKYIKIDSSSKLTKFILEEGDILVSLTGDVGRVGVIREEHLPAALNQRVARVQSLDASFDRHFLFHYLNSAVFRNQVEALGKGAAQSNVSTKDILAISLELPPLAEQQRIVAKLDAAFAEIDRAVDIEESKLQESLKLRASVLAAAMYGEHWQTIKLVEVCTLRNGRAYKKPELLADGKYPVLRVGNFFTSNHWYFSDLELDATKYCDDGDLLYAWSASFGPRIWDGGKVIYHYHIWRVDVDESKVHKRFLFYWFEYDKELVKAAHGTGTTMMHVSKGSMEKRDIHLPSLEEQKQIVERLDSAQTKLVKMCDTTIKAKENYALLKSAILAQELQPPQSEAA